jgi:hypothetical protein
MPGTTTPCATGSSASTGMNISSSSGC